MSDLFNLAAKRAFQMSQPPPQKISINIEICQPSEGVLSSIQKGIDIGGEPHKLAYINSDESSLLKAIGAEGEPMEGTNGIPAYAFVDPNMIVELIKQQQEGKKPSGNYMQDYLDLTDWETDPRYTGPEEDILTRIYSGTGKGSENTKFLERIASYLNETTPEEEVEVVEETA